MLFSLALIFISSLSLAVLCHKLKLPQLIGFLAVGMILGPYVLNLIDAKILAISIELRQIALIMILTRAGLSLNISDLRKIGRPAILISFIPAIIEIAAFAIFAPLLFGVSLLDSLIMGSILAAVSPAVIVPRAIKMIEKGEGTKKCIPQLITAGASVDDILVIVLFTVFTGMATGGDFNALALLNIPAFIITGTVIGLGAGFFLVAFFKKFHMRDSIKVIILLSIAFFFVVLEEAVSEYIGFSGLIAIMVTGIVILNKYKILAQRLSEKYSKLWIFAEILLFVMVGAAVNINLILDNIGYGALLILLALILRTFGVFLSLIKTKLNNKEKLFCSISYMPKATVQAAFGGIPLALGLASGNLILSIAVLSIILTAPVGAYLMDLTKNPLVVNSSNKKEKKK